jgi:nitroreductase
VKDVPDSAGIDRSRRRYPDAMPPSAPDVLAHLHRHRSVRRFRPDPIPDDVLRRVLEAGIRASSSGNMQAYSIVVTRDRGLRERLHAPHLGQDMVLEAPALLTFCADFHRMRRWLALSEAEDGFDDVFAFLVGAIDAVLVSQNVALAAEAEGLGICYLGSTLANCHEIGRILRLPRHVVPVAGLVMGTAAEDPPLRDRLPLDGLVHFDTYDDPDDDRVREVYRAREAAGWARYMAIPELRQRVEAAGVRNLAQIYTTVKYTRASHEIFARNVLDYLRAQGFLPPG